MNLQQAKVCALNTPESGRAIACGFFTRNHGGITSVICDSPDEWSRFISRVSWGCCWWKTSKRSRRCNSKIKRSQPAAAPTPTVVAAYFAYGHRSCRSCRRLRSFAVSCRGRQWLKTEIQLQRLHQLPILRRCPLQAEPGVVMLGGCLLYTSDAADE